MTYEEWSATYATFDSSICPKEAWNAALDEALYLCYRWDANIVNVVDAIKELKSD